MIDEYDTHAKAFEQKKLDKLEEEIRNILQDQYKAFGPEAGYRKLAPVEDVLKVPRSAASGSGGPSPDEINAELKRRGLMK